MRYYALFALVTLAGFSVVCLLVSLTPVQPSNGWSFRLELM